MKSNLQVSLEMLEDVVRSAEMVEFYRGIHPEAFNMELDLLKLNVQKWRNFCEDKSYPARLSDCRKVYYCEMEDGPLKLGDYVETSLGKGKIIRLDYSDNSCRIEPVQLMSDDEEDE